LIVNVLQDYGILKKVKEVADGKGKHTDDIRDKARTVYERWAIHVQEIRGKPRWKIKSRPESDVVRYVLQRE